MRTSIKTVASSLFLLSTSAAALVHCSSTNGSGGPGTGSDAGTGTDHDGGATGDDAATGSDGGGNLPDANSFDAGPACGSAAECSGGSATVTCCSGHCVDTALDPRNCGGCGVACTQAQFCNGTKCNDAVFANVCGNPAATVVWDAYDADNDAGAKVAQALHDKCSPAVTFTQQTNETLVTDPSGRPILGVGNTYLIGGGWYGHAGMNFMDNNKLTRVQVNGDGTHSFIRNLASQADLVNILTTSLTASHDYFIIELAVEPVSGTLCFAATGMLVPGTDAAAWYLANKVVPNPSAYPDAWYAFGWDDTDANGAPSEGDTFTPYGSGK